MAAAALAAAADQKDMGWVKTGKIAKEPELTDPLQLYSLCEQRGVVLPKKRRAVSSRLGFAS